jgi:UDP-N-acetylmuramoyl-tripeptide--D-alanyl-D-alanine ligase
VFEIGMNHAGEIAPLTRLARPHTAIVTTVGPVHLEFFGSVEEIADAKAEIFLGVEPGGAAVINRDGVHFERLRRHARAAGIATIVSFGEHPDADARLVDAALDPDGSRVRAIIMGRDVAYRLGSPGRHVAINSLAVLAAASLTGVDVVTGASALAALQPPTGRGRRVGLALPGGTALLIDEAYNANPFSMRAALSLLGQSPVGRGGRRIAVLGDMLELGPQGKDLHAELAEPIRREGIDLVFCAGPLMAALWEALPSALRGVYAKTAAELQPDVLGAIRAGDAVMVKGSLGSRMGPIVAALIDRFSAPEPATPAAAQG